MSFAPPNRREFLAASVQLMGGGWAALHLPLLTSLAACARDAAGRGEPLTTLSETEARALTALAARILPSDGELPGAVESGAVHFIDLALGSFFQPLLPLIQEGVRDLDTQAGGSFAALSPERQDALLTELQQTPFFFNARLLVLSGVLADPRYGGNQDEAGPKLLGIGSHGAHTPPFGWYDAEYARTGGEAA